MKESRSSETESSAPQSGLRALVGSVFTGDRVLWIIIAALAVISVLVVYSSTAKMAYDAHTARSTAHFTADVFAVDRGRQFKRQWNRNVRLVQVRNVIDEGAFMSGMDKPQSRRTAERLDDRMRRAV